MKYSPPSLTQLRRHQTGIHINMVRCSWDLAREFNVAAAFKDHLVHVGPALIFAADTGDALHSFEIDGHATWSIWLPVTSPATRPWFFPEGWLSAATPATHPQAAMAPQCCTSWCILPHSQRLPGFSPVHNNAYTSPWMGGPHSQLCPDGVVLISLMVIDRPDRDSTKRTPQALTDPFGYTLGFHHMRLEKGSLGSAMIKSYRRNKPAGPTNGQTPQPHPFLMAWLPGTCIYAAAALGYIYIVDAFNDRVLSMRQTPHQCTACRARRRPSGTELGCRVTSDGWTELVGMGVKD